MLRLALALCLAFLILAATANAGYPSYAPPVYEYQQQIIAIPVAPDYYYSVGHAASEDRIAQKVAELMAKQATPAVAAEAPDDAAFKVVGRSGDPVARIFQARCIACHKPGAKGPGVSLLTADRKAFRLEDPTRELARRARVYESIESGEMPKDAPPLTPAQKAVLKGWAKRPN